MRVIAGKIKKERERVKDLGIKKKNPRLNSNLASLVIMANTGEFVHINPLQETLPHPVSLKYICKDRKL